MSKTKHLIPRLLVFLMFIFASCGSSDEGRVEEAAGPPESVRFLWREERYDETLQDTFNTIVINDTLSRSLSDPKRAALGFVATFVGSECYWDGAMAVDRSNLQCKVLTALDLGYQCSETHLGFLRNWFRNDSSSLKQLETCPTIPYTATVQSSFDYINLTIWADTIEVTSGISGMNMRAGEHWSWREIDWFKINGNTISHVGSERTETAHTKGTEVSD